MLFSRVWFTISCENTAIWLRTCIRVLTEKNARERERKCITFLFIFVSCFFFLLFCCYCRPCIQYFGCFINSVFFMFSVFSRCLCHRSVCTVFILSWSISFARTTNRYRIHWHGSCLSRHLALFSRSLALSVSCLFAKRHSYVCRCVDDSFNIFIRLFSRFVCRNITRSLMIIISMCFFVYCCWCWDHTLLELDLRIYNAMSMLVLYAKHKRIKKISCCSFCCFFSLFLMWIIRLLLFSHFFSVIFLLSLFSCFLLISPTFANWTV